MVEEGDTKNTKKHVLILSIVLTVMLSSIFLIPDDIGSTTSASVISGSVIQQFQEVDEGENVRVFVKLKDASDVEGIGPIKSVRGAILESKKENLKEDIEDKTRHDFGDIVSVELSESDAKSLAKEGAVESIELVEVRELFLGDSVPLIGAQETGNFEIGEVKLRGNGQSVCVLDTGIDYNHNDFGVRVLTGYDFANDDNDSIDDHNHGTHVSGIIGADGDVVGVAPGVNLISAKVCTKSGLCFDDDIIAGMDYCLNNSAKYNISVISMSLGGGLHTDYCNDDPLAAKINEVVANNISMVAASGNSGNSGGISAPACVQSAFPVGSTTKNDEISSFSNRNILLDIVAPGSSIYSTTIGSHGTLSGTSMATPHVSGVLAVLNQYLSYFGIVKTPLELESVLKQSGKLIEDSRSGLNYSRVDLYQGLKLLDEHNPEVNLNALVNESIICTGRDLNLVSGRFELSNSSDLILNLSYENLNVSIYEFNVNLSNLSYGIYNTSCFFEDWNGNIGSDEGNVAISTLDLFVNNPVEGQLIKNDDYSFVCNASSVHELSAMNISVHGLSAMNISIEGNTSTLLEDSINVSGLDNSSSFELGLGVIADGNYSLVCGALNSLGKSSSSSAVSFEYVPTRLVLNIISPASEYVNENILEFEADSESSCVYLLGNVSKEIESNDSLNFLEEMNISQGNNSLEVRCIGLEENLSSNASIDFVLDLTSPVITLDRPRGDEEIEEGDLSFTYSIVESNNIALCSLLVDNVSRVNSGGFSSSFEKNLAAGDYNWAVNCSDYAGNVGFSEVRPLEVISASTQEGSSGGSSSGESSGGGGSGSGGGGSSSVGSSSVTEEVVEETVIEEPEEPRITIGEADLTGDVVSDESPGVSAGLTGQAIGDVDESSIDKRLVLIILSIFGLVGFFAYRQGKKFFGEKEEKLVHGLR